MVYGSCFGVLGVEVNGCQDVRSLVAVSSAVDSEKAEQATDLVVGAYLGAVGVYAAGAAGGEVLATGLDLGVAPNGKGCTPGLHELALIAELGGGKD
jgi:hypothetical protein